MHAQAEKIAIIGGGIAGLTLAICLEGKGYHCQIFEKQAELQEVGAAISIFPNALRVFRSLGMMEDVLASSGEMTQVFMKTAQGKVLAKSKPQYDLPTVCMHRADLHSILLSHTTAERFPAHELSSLKNLPDGKVEVVFQNGQQQTFDAVIGADGIHSVVRQYVIGDGKPVFRGYNIWRGVVDADFAIGYGSETYGKGKRVGIVPIKNGKYGWWATCNEAFMEDDEPEGTKAKLQRLFGDWHHPIPELMAKTEHILKNSLADRLPKAGWSKGNITLLGDAAHPTTPNLGQGGCMAIEGAYLLAKAIEKYGLGAKAFQRYEALHFPRTKSVTEESLRMGKMGQLENPLAIFFRNNLFKLMPSSLAMKMIDKYFSYDVNMIKV